MGSGRPAGDVTLQHPDDLELGAALGETELDVTRVRFVGDMRVITMTHNAELA